MRKFFILALFVSLFVVANSVWAQSDNQKNKAPAKVETSVKKANASKTTTVCCPENKEGCLAKAGGTNTCPVEKKANSKAPASCCTNKEAANATKSSGKKTN